MRFWAEELRYASPYTKAKAIGQMLVSFLIIWQGINMVITLTMMVINLLVATPLAH